MYNNVFTHNGYSIEWVADNIAHANTVPLRCDVTLARHSFARLLKLVTLLSTIDCTCL